MDQAGLRLLYEGRRWHTHRTAAATYGVDPATMARTLQRLRKKGRLADHEVDELDGRTPAYLATAVAREMRARPSTNRNRKDQR